MITLATWSWSPRTVTVGVGDVKTSSDPSSVIVTHALGSCLGIVTYDRAARAAGMLHALLPTAAVLPQRARENPHLFVDTGLHALCLAMVRLGASRANLEVSVVGGASVGGDFTTDHFQIGRKNIEALRPLLRSKGLRVHRHLLAGTSPRTLWVSVADGRVSATAGTVDLPLEEGEPW
jgi:chemotaxis protein CheD